MARRFDVALDEEPADAEVAATQALHGRERRAQRALVGAERHPDAAAAGRALQHHRIADALGLDAGMLDIRQETAPWQQRNAGSRRDQTGLVLQAEAADLLRRRPDEREPVAFARRREIGVLTEQAVARVHRVGLVLARDRAQPIDGEVALFDRRRTDADRDVRQRDVLRLRIRLGEHRDRFDVEPPERPDDAARDLAAIRDEHPADHDAPAVDDGRCIRRLNPRRGCESASDSSRCRDC